MRPRPAESIKVFFQRQLAMPGDQQALYWKRIFLEVGLQDLSGELRQGCLLQSDFGKRGGRPTVVRLNWREIYIILLFRHDARVEANGIVVRAPG